MRAKFILCDFNANLNGVKLNRKTIESWYLSILNQPLVGKIRGNDFTGHNMRLVTQLDSEGNVEKSLEFDTDAFGTFVEVAIEEIDGVEYLTATAEIWSRFPRACKVIASRIASGILHSSWEISVESCWNENGIEVIDLGKFTAHCMLAKSVTPAYDCSRLLQVASEESDVELAEAYAEDCEKNKSQEETMAKENQSAAVADEHVNPTPENDAAQCGGGKKEKKKDTAVDTAKCGTPSDKAKKDKSESAAENQTTEVSALTDYDLRRKISVAYLAKTGCDGWCSFLFPTESTAWISDYSSCKCDLEYMLAHYTVENDTVTIDEPQKVSLCVSIQDVNATMAEKDGALAAANEMIQTLRADLEMLLPYKEQAEKDAAAKAEAETAEKRTKLSAYALQSKLILKSELNDPKSNVFSFIQNIDTAAVNQLIATRFMESLSEKDSDDPAAASGANLVATAGANPKTALSLEGETDEVSVVSLFNAYIGK